MNREQKIALIIGFAVILVVGVLVSDHLSAAQRLDIADATEGDLGRVEARPIAALPDPGATRLVDRPREVPSEAPVTRDYADASQPDPTPAFVPVGAPDEEPLRITQGGQNTLGEAMERASQRDLRIGAADSPRPINDAIRDLGDRLAEGMRNGLPAATRLDGDRGAGQGGAMTGPTYLDRDAGPKPSRETEPAKPVRHTVTKDESLYKIAARYLGNGNRWREIADANGGKVGSDGSVRAGVTLVIPGAGAPQQAPAERVSPQAAPAKKTPTTYTVAKNDSLSQIAQRTLGSVRYMDQIIRANPDKIRDPDDIRVGMVLTIPARS